MTRDPIAKIYAGLASNYDEIVFRDRDYTAYEVIPEWILEKNLLQPNVLDLGCGTGLSALKFLKQGYPVTGIDLTIEMIQKAKKLPFQQLICQSLLDPFPLADDEFSIVTLLGVMEFIQSPCRLFNEVHRVLKNGGLFGLTVPLKLSFEQERQVGVYSFHPAEIEALFAQSSFSVERKEALQGFVAEGVTVRYSGYLLKKP